MTCKNVKKGVSCESKKRVAYLATLIPGIVLSLAYIYGLIAAGVVHDVPLGEGMRVIIYLYVIAPILTVVGVVLIIISYLIKIDKIKVK